MSHLFVVAPTNEESLLTAVERAMGQPVPALATLPTLTNLALGDPYLAEQLTGLHQKFELLPAPTRGLLARLRTCLAWWLLGTEMQQLNHVNAALIRALDSLTVHLDHERAARRRIEEHLAALPPTSQPPVVSCQSPVDTLHPPSSTLHPRRLVWHSSFASPTGYSGSSCAFVLGLDARGVEVRPLYLYGTDRDEFIQTGKLHPRIMQLQTRPIHLDVPQVVYAPGDRFHKNSGRYRIGFTMLEVDRLPPSWVEQANQMDEIWTPTSWGAEIFQHSGIQRPIFVQPLGVDADRFVPATPRTRLRDHTIFLSVFEWDVRKGWEILLRAYRAAFRPDDPVLLLLKIDCRTPAANPLREIARLLPAPSPAAGLIYNQTLSTAQLVELYQSSDCFVLPTHGEGWGMPILEAMACGLPAIATDWSAPTTFLDPSHSYPLPIRGLVPAESDNPYCQGANWAQPDETALVDLLRHVANNPDERQQKGQQAYQAARQWSWERSVDQIYQRLEAICSPGEVNK